MANAKNPKWRTEAAVRAGMAVKELAAAYRERLEPRLGAALLDGLAADLDELRGATSGAVSVRAGKRAATVGQADAAQQGSRLAIAIRSAVRQALPDDRAAQKGFGVGLSIRKESVASVASALQMVVDASEKDPARVRDAGVLPQDLDLAKQALSTLLSADAKQESRKVNAKQATASRVATQLRVEAAVGKILGAAAVEFHNQPDIAARFAAIVPGHSGKSKSGSAPSPAAT
jgi:hypothetical protein